MWVLSQAHPHAPLEAADDTIQQTHAARRLGCEVWHLPGRLRLEEVPAAFEGLEVSQPQPAIWIGYIPTQAVYEAVYEHARRRGLRLLNDPDEHHVAFEFDRAYPRLEGLTPKTTVVTDVAGVDAAVSEVGLPTFIRGAMLSNKGKGRAACVAETVDQARTLVRDLLENEHLSRGRALLRTFLELRTQPIAGFDFPAGREYRVFLYRGEVVARGFYWPYLLEFAELTPDEAAEVEALAKEAAQRLPTPWLSLDIAQTRDGRWVLIETGDPQFSGLGLIDPEPMLRALLAAVAATMRR